MRSFMMPLVIEIDFVGGDQISCRSRGPSCTVSR